MSKWQRTCFAIGEAWRHRRQLFALGRNPTWHRHHVTELTVEFLHQQDIRCLILDFDGVMSPHGDITPLPEVIDWLNRFIKDKPPVQIYVLSNKPMPEREAWLKQHFPHITFVKGVRKKPYPDGLKLIIDQVKLPARQVVLVDDRLLTGMLACILAGCHGLWITRAYRNCYNRLWCELFFSSMRALEKLLFKA